jgi:hypothetical protein
MLVVVLVVVLVIQAHQADPLVVVEVAVHQVQQALVQEME